MLKRLRDYFDDSGALSVDTPALSPYAASDIQIESLEVRSALSAEALYLHTSPEFCMKRLLADGYPDIYSICRVFRDGEAGKSHQPEFTMVEWYRLDMTLDDIVTDTIRTIAFALDQAHLANDVISLNYCDAFLNITGIDLASASIGDLASAANADEDLRATLGDHRDDWLDLILATRIVPTFSTNKLTILQHYPISQAALARPCPSNAAYADRFEVFFGALELANGYVELTDVNEQKDRIAADQNERNRRERSLRPRDEALLSALESGLPDCAGVAMGLERLQMISDKTDDIRDVVSFAFEDGNE